MPALQSAGYTKSFVSNKDIILDDFSNKTMTTPEDKIRLRLGSNTLWDRIDLGA